MNLFLFYLFGEDWNKNQLFFSMPYFEKLVRDGEWDDVEKYLGGFTEVNDSAYSVETFFEIRKQKYLEALDKFR